MQGGGGERKREKRKERKTSYKRKHLLTNVKSDWIFQGVLTFYNHHSKD